MKQPEQRRFWAVWSTKAGKWVVPLGGFTLDRVDYHRYDDPPRLFTSYREAAEVRDVHNASGGRAVVKWILVMSR